MDIRVRKKAKIIICFLLIAAVAGTQFVNFGSANPFTNSRYSGERGPPSSAKSPVAMIQSPESNQVYNKNYVTLSLNANVEEFLEGGYNSPLISGMKIDQIYFNTDWMPNSTYIKNATHIRDGDFAWGYSGIGSDEVSASLNLTEIPDGKHTIRVYVVARGSIIDPMNWYTFKKVGSSQVDFTIDTIPPKVTVFPIENKTYAESEVPLIFNIDDSVSKICYILDWQDSVMINGNTTLSGLGNGDHSVKVFGWDTAGNVGHSETVTFNVVEPFPTLPFAVVSTASISALGAGFLLLIRKKMGEAGKA